MRRRDYVSVAHHERVVAGLLRTIAEQNDRIMFLAGQAWGLPERDVPVWQPEQYEPDVAYDATQQTDS